MLFFFQQPLQTTENKYAFCSTESRVLAGNMYDIIVTNLFARKRTNAIVLIVVKSVWTELTASHIQVACLFVQWKQGQVHGAGAGQRDADAVQDVTVWEHSDVQIWLKDVVEPTDLFVPEKCVWHPDFSRVCHGQVADLFCNKGQKKD